LPGHAGSWHETGCDRQLMQRDGKWMIEPLDEN
jgi:ATP phosphoribosyltransferase regulatory subunit